MKKRLGWAILVIIAGTLLGALEWVCIVAGIWWLLPAIILGVAMIMNLIMLAVKLIED